MRTNIDLDDALMAEAMEATGLPTEKATVEEGLRVLVRRHEQWHALAELKGVEWEGDLDSPKQGADIAPEK